MTQTLERYLTRAEEQQLLKTVAAANAVHAKRDHAWMLLLRHTGIRVGTLRGLNVRHAREALRTKHLAYEGAIAKRGKPGKVPCNEKARKALRALLKIHKRMSGTLLDDSPLIVSRKHRRMSVRAFQARQQQWRELAGLPVDASPHWFRHTYAQRVMENSEAANPQRLVQRLLNHSSIKSTEIYTRPTREELVRAAEAAA